MVEGETMTLPFEMLAPAMSPVTYAGKTYVRRRGVMAPQGIGGSAK